MKIIGSVLIIISCGFLGLDFYKKCLSSTKYTQGLISGFEFIKSEISFSQSVISDIFLRGSVFAGSAKGFFELIGKEINAEGMTINTAFEKNKCILKNCCNKQVYYIVSDAILQLGTSDTDSQIMLLESTIEKLKKALELQNSFCNKEGVMCKKVGFILGMAVSLLLL